MNYKKLIAGIMAVTLMGSGAVLPPNAVKTISDSFVLSASAAEDYSCSSFDFKASTGTMTLKGNVNADDVKNFSQKESVMSITAQKGTAFPSNCGDLFSNYAKTESIDLKNVNTSNVTNMGYMFYNCESLKSLDLSSFATSSVTIMESMFKQCASLTSLDLSSFDTKKVKEMLGMFDGCSSLISLDLRGFDTRNVTNMYEIFYDCSSLTFLDVSSFNTQNVTNMDSMFYNCSSLTFLDLRGFDTSHVSDVGAMFTGCSSLKKVYCSETNYNRFVMEGNMRNTVVLLKGELSVSCESFDFDAVTGVMTLKGNVNANDIKNFSQKEFVTSVTAQEGTVFPESCRDLFSDYAKTESIDLKNVNTSSVKSMFYMFADCASLTSLDVSRFDTENVTAMDGMFFGCSSLKSLDVSSFNTSNVGSMEHMFASCSSLSSLDLSGFNTEKVSDMRGMFKNCSSLTVLDLSGFDTRYVKNMNSMFFDCASLTSLDVSRFDTNSVTDMDEMFTMCSELKKICCSESSYNRFISEGRISKNVVLIKDNPRYSCDSFDFNAVTGVMTLKGNVNADDIKNFSQKESVTSVTAKEGTVLPGDCEALFSLYEKIESIDLKNADTSNVTNMIAMFIGCSSLTSLDLSVFNTGNVTNMASVFYNCSSLTSLDLSSFDTSKVTDMKNMFFGCRDLRSLNLNSFNTGSVTNMSNMFSECSSLTSLDLSKFDTSHVKAMNDMFSYCTALESLNISSFDTSNVTAMGNMFMNCVSLTSLDLSSFDTNMVISMNSMFDNCESLTSLDLSGFDTSNVKSMSYMFSHCSSLTSLDVCNFNTNNVELMTNMFNYCSALKGITCTQASYDRFVSDGKLSSNVKLNNIELTADSLSKLIEEYKPGKLIFSKTKPANISGAVNLIKYKYISGYYNKLTDALIIWSEKGNGICLPSDCTGYFKGMTSLKSVNLSGLNTFNITNMTNMFYGCTNLESIDMSMLDTSNVQNFSGIFRNCSNLTNANLSGLVTPAATNMDLMFTSCSSLESVDMTGWNTANVTSMKAVFDSCSSLTSLDLRGWNTEKVTDMQSMFYSCRNLKSVDVSGFDTNKVTNMSKMFQYCWSLEKLDLRNFDIVSASPVLTSMLANTDIKEIACASNAYSKYVSEGSLKSSAVRVDELCIPAEFNGNTMSLGGSISVNFYVIFNDTPLEQLKKSYVEFTVNGKTQTAKFDETKMNSDKTKYGFTCVLNSVSMADDINAKLVYFDKYGIQHTTETVYTAQTYINTAIAKSKNAKMVTLAKTINNYGYYMQKYLAKTNGWTIGTDHIGMEKNYTSADTYSKNKETYLSELSAYKKTESLTADIAKVNYSLSLDSDTSINVKITPAANYTGSITATVDGKKATLTKQSDGRYALKIANIPAHELSAMHTVSIKTAKGTSTYKVSALSFAYDCINAGTSNAERYNAACALYEYYKAAKAYKG